MMEYDWMIHGNGVTSKSGSPPDLFGKYSSLQMFLKKLSFGAPVILRVNAILYDDGKKKV
jgi:hypothetical protein